MNYSNKGIIQKLFRNQEKIISSLKQLPEFRKFVFINNISDETLKNASNTIFYQFAKKGTVLFKQNEKSDYFFGILKGRISIRRLNFKFRIINKNDNLINYSNV